MMESAVPSLLEDSEKNDVTAVRLRLEDEKEKRILLNNDVEMLMLKVAGSERQMNHLLQKVAELERQMTQVIQGRQCPSNYTWHMPLNLCFRLSQEKQTWGNAKVICESEGGHLAKVNDTPIFVYLKEQIKKGPNIPRVSYTSIGGNDIEEEGIWRWADGELIDTKSPIWYPEVQGGRNENCLIMNSEVDYRMLDTSCFLMHYYLCQIG